MCGCLGGVGGHTHEIQMTCGKAGGFVWFCVCVCVCVCVCACVFIMEKGRKNVCVCVCVVCVLVQEVGRLGRMGDFAGI